MNSELTIKFANQSKYGQEAEAEQRKILASIPEEVRKTLPEDDDAATLAYIDQYYAIAGGNKPVAQGATNVGAIQTGAAIPAAARKALDTFDARTRNVRKEKAAKTTITKLHVDKPWMGTWLKSETTVVPEMDLEKLESYRPMVVQDEENLAAYEAAVKAVKEKIATKVKIVEEGKANKKVLGYEVSTPGDEAGTGANIVRTFTAKQLVGFVAIELCGYIANVPGQLGCKLGSKKPSGKKIGAEGVAAIPTLKFAGKADVIKNPAMVEVVSRIKQKGGQNETKTGTVRTVLSFKIDSGKKNKKQEPIIKTVTLQGKTQVPLWERTNAKFEELYGTATKDNKVITAPSGLEAEEADAILRNTLFYVQQESSAYGQKAKEFALSLADQVVASPSTGGAMDL